MHRRLEAGAAAALYRHSGLSSNTESITRCRTAAVGRFENVTYYAELIADFFGPFHDLRTLDAKVEPVLHKDPAIAYKGLARQLRIDNSSNGII
jgi:hypothetical protein